MMTLRYWLLKLEGCLGQNIECNFAFQYAVELKQLQNDLQIVVQMTPGKVIEEEVVNADMLTRESIM